MALLSPFLRPQEGVGCGFLFFFCFGFSFFLLLGGFFLFCGVSFAFCFGLFFCVIPGCCLVVLFCWGGFLLCFFLVVLSKVSLFPFCTPLSFID